MWKFSYSGSIRRCQWSLITDQCTTVLKVLLKVFSKWSTGHWSVLFYVRTLVTNHWHLDCSTCEHSVFPFDVRQRQIWLKKVHWTLKPKVLSHTKYINKPPPWDFGLWTTGFWPPWTLDFGILTPLDFGLRDFDPLGLWTSAFGIERRTSWLAMWHVSHNHFYSGIYTNLVW